MEFLSSILRFSRKFLNPGFFLSGLPLPRRNILRKITPFSRNSVKRGFLVLLTTTRARWLGILEIVLGLGRIIVALSLNHQTAAEFAARFWARLRDAYARGDKFEFSRLIWWIWNRIQLGDFTSDQVRLSFNAAYGRSLNIGAWNTLVTTRFIPAKDRYLAMLAENDL